MRETYDFSDAVKNPYSAKLKRQITIRLDSTTIDYFKDLSEETGIKYQQLWIFR
jgi:predicted DNA binding CopG/RHH family protein